MLPVCIFYVAFFAHLAMLIKMTQLVTPHTRAASKEFQWAKPW
jgi:hypothetical protein